jgi:hypothetical protein
MAVGFAVNAEMFRGVFVLERAFFGKVGPTAGVADIRDFLTVGHYMSGIDGVTFIAPARFW